MDHSSQTANAREMVTIGSLGVAWLADVGGCAAIGGLGGKGLGREKNTEKKGGKRKGNKGVRGKG